LPPPHGDATVNAYIWCTCLLFNTVKNGHESQVDRCEIGDSTQQILYGGLFQLVTTFDLR
jgi:hypothetical protein